MTTLACNHPANKTPIFLGIWKQSLCSVSNRKVGSSVDDTSQRHVIDLMQVFNPIKFINLTQVVMAALNSLEAAVLSTSALRGYWAKTIMNPPEKVWLQ